jgi:hypothetical protein
MIVERFTQTMLFMVIAHYPAYYNNRISNVDVAWPVGLFLIGVQVANMGEGWYPRVYIISCFYVMVGGKKGLEAIINWINGKMEQELPHYEYRQIYWK